MSRIPRLVSYAAIAAVIAVIAVPTVWTVRVAASHSKQALTVIHINRYNTNEKFLGTGKGPALGDRFVFNGNETSGGSQVGRDFGSCTLVAKTRTLCEIQANLWHLGHLEIEGAPTLTSRTTVFAVVGGTGIFAGAHGWALDHSYGKNGSKDHITVYLRP